MIGVRAKHGNEETKEMKDIDGYSGQRHSKVEKVLQDKNNAELLEETDSDEDIAETFLKDIRKKFHEYKITIRSDAIKLKAAHEQIEILQMELKKVKDAEC